PGLSVLFTAERGTELPARPGRDTLWQRVPAETLAETEAFAAHWRPDCGLWAGGTLRPALLAAVDQADVPLFMIDAGADEIGTGPGSWMPALVRTSQARFACALVRSEVAARRLQRLGVAPDDIAMTGPLREGAAALPCDMTEFDRMGQVLAGRPIWLAAMVQPGELDTVLRAHRATARLSHRLLLILVPDSTDMGDTFVAALDRAGLRHVRWSEGGLPDENTQVLLADTRGEMGLWYRLAPVTLMASSLEPGHGGRDPYEPAALGSAVLYGPNVGRHLGPYGRLSGAAAARIVKDSESLATALAELVAPDRAAVMAQAAWDIVSEGADVTDRITDLVLDTLDLGAAR
ncbi:MAG: 3-deoxy-D-manno-octulosonic acid transferase, partial [Paracoccaceae bacterium]